MAKLFSSIIKSVVTLEGAHGAAAHAMGRVAFDALLTDIETR